MILSIDIFYFKTVIIGGPVQYVKSEISSYLLIKCISVTGLWLSPGDFLIKHFYVFEKIEEIVGEDFFYPIIFLDQP